MRSKYRVILEIDTCDDGITSTQVVKIIDVTPTPDEDDEGEDEE